MARKKRLVDGDLFDADDAHQRLKLDVTRHVGVHGDVGSHETFMSVIASGKK